MGFFLDILFVLILEILTGNRFILLPKTTGKTDKIYEKKSLKTLDRRKLRTVIPERQEINEVSLQLSLLQAWRKSTGCGAKRGIPRRVRWYF